MASSDDHSSVLRFGVYEVDRRARELRRQGVRIRLQDQPFHVLVRLLERSGEVVTREELREALWPSSVFVDFDHGLNNAIARLREALGDSAVSPRFIETLPRLGYRFIYPVERMARRGAASAGASSSATPVPDSPARESVAPSSQAAATVERDDEAVLSAEVGGWSRSRWAVTAAVAAAVVVAAALTAWFVANRSLEPPRPTVVASRAPSVAVVPFVNLGADADDERFADGLSGELINKLAAIRGLTVAGQTSSFYLKGKRATPAEIARTLNVDHLLEGSVRRSELRLRITAQLIDATTGYQLWAETFDRNATDVIQIQEEIALAVANALQVRLLASDEQRLRKRLTRDPEAYRLYLLARAQISWVFGRPDWAVVRRSYEEAIERDPEFAAAYAGLAHNLFNFAANEDDIRLGREAADRAVALDPELGDALGARANWELFDYQSKGDYGSYQRALEDYRHALELDPRSTLVLFHYARAVLWSDPALALELFEETTRIDPVRFSAVGFSALLTSGVLGRHEAARRRVYDLYEQNPDQKFHNALHVAALEMRLGRLDDASIFLRESLEQGDRGSATQLWGLYMSLGDRDAAQHALTLLEWPALRAAAELTMDGRYDAAFEWLDRGRDEPARGRDLDVAVARLALIAGDPERALTILESRLPDLAAGIEPIDMRNVLPAIDLAAARLWTGRTTPAHALLARIDEYLDGPSAPHWPMYVFLRARTHALEGDIESAQRVLDRAYEHGFRMTWALDALPRGFWYVDAVDADPAFAAMRDDPRFLNWLERIRADNARQLAQLKAREQTSPRVAGATGSE